MSHPINPLVQEPKHGNLCLHTGKQSGQAQLVFSEPVGGGYLNTLRTYSLYSVQAEKITGIDFFFLFMSYLLQSDFKSYLVPKIFFTVTPTPASFAVQERGWHFPCIWEFLSSGSLSCFHGQGREQQNLCCLALGYL